MKKCIMPFLLGGLFWGASMSAFSADTWRMNIPFRDIAKESFSLTLEHDGSNVTNGVLPEGMINKPYEFDFKSLLNVQGADPSFSVNDIQWSLVTQEGQTMPTGINLSADGVLSGTPTIQGEASFKVLAVHQDAQGENVYTIKVGDAVFYVKKITAGGGHTCAIDTANKAWCWGRNYNGQLGDGSTKDRSTPVAVSGLTSVTEITAGAGYTCAIDGANKAWCWGNRGSSVYNRLGTGIANYENYLTPVPVSTKTGLTSVAKIEAGLYHTCAIDTENKAWCWGSNTHGQLGNGTTSDGTFYPVAVSDLTGLTSVTEITAAGSAGFLTSHTCAIDGEGKAWCWGYNNHGQLGNGTIDNQNHPYPVAVSDLTGLTSVAKIAAGGFHTCAIDTADKAWCWGAIVQQPTPVAVLGLTSVAEITAGGGHACAIDTAGKAWCWGWNYYGQSGDGTTKQKTTPVAVVGLTSVAKIAAGEYHTCAIDTAGKAWCWGWNHYGEFGNGTGNNTSSTPVPVKPPSELP